MSIRAMEEEILNQAEDIPKFALQVRKSYPSKLKPSNLIFAGSGDSYAAAVFAQELSREQAVASDPYELLRNIKRAREKNLVIVSVSGKTRTNVTLARRARKFARKTIAITADLDSPLAYECDETLMLRYRKGRMLTSGTISFTCNLIACAFLLGRLPKGIDVKNSIRKAAHWARTQVRVGPGSFVFIGSGVNHALSLYGAAKVREVLGAKAEADYPEQLGHARLFTIDKKRDTIVCISSGQDQALKVHALLVKNGFRTNLVKPNGDDVVQTSLEIAIHFQQLALAIAKNMGMKECTFLADPRTLELSSKMIY